MQELIESIRIAVAEGATAEQKQAGIRACGAILAALGAEPGKPIAVPPARPLSGLSFDQMLELLIARLSVIAKEREQRPPIPASPTPTAPTPTGPTPSAPTVARGLRVPLRMDGALRVAVPRAAARPSLPHAPARSPNAPPAVPAKKP